MFAHSVSALIVADDPALSSGLTAAMARLGYREPAVVPLASAHVRAPDGGKSACGITVIGLATADGAQLSLARDIVEASTAGKLLVLRLDADAASRVSAQFSALVPVVMAGDDDALRVAVESAVRTGAAEARHQRSVWELRVVSELADVLCESLDVEGMLGGALAGLARAFEAAGASIRLRNDLSGEYEVVAERGAGNAAIFGDLSAVGLSARIDEVIATRQPVIVDDIAWPSTLGRLDGETAGVRSIASVPMLVGGEVIGTLSLVAARSGRFGPADAGLLTAIAGRIAGAVQNARVHAAVLRGRHEWEHAFDAISDPIAVFDRTGALLRGNLALATLLGTPVTGLSQKCCQDVGFCSGSYPQCEVGDAVQRGAAGRAELTRANGQIFSVTTFPVGGVSGPAVVQVAQNVTEEIRSARRLKRLSGELAAANSRLTATVEQLKSTQAQLLQAEKLSALGQLVAGVAHELNNPLTSVIGYAQLLEDELLDGGWSGPRRPVSDIAQDLRHIVEESERAARIVRNLLAFARRQSAARAPQDIVELMTRVLSLRAYDLRLSGIELTTRYQANLPPIVADGGQIQQALLNLILNAEQAMRGHATRRLTVAVSFDAAASAIELSFTDTGHGMDTASLARIFDPFFTTRKVGDGAGLGLSICYGVVRDHGGQIVVDSRVQVGTTFSVLLPACSGEGAGAQAEPVLIAHSDQGERDFISAALIAWGYAVLSTADAGEALTRYRGSPVQAILVDRGILARDLAGWSAARRNDPRRTRLVLMARPAEDRDIDRFGEEQASAVLTPPFHLRALRAAIRAVVKECV